MQQCLAEFFNLFYSRETCQDWGPSLVGGKAIEALCYFDRFNFLMLILPQEDICCGQETQESHCCVPVAGHTWGVELVLLTETFVFPWHSRARPSAWQQQQQVCVWGTHAHNGSVNVLACKILPESFQSMVNAGDHRLSFNSMISDLLKRAKIEIIRFILFLPLQFSPSIALQYMGQLPPQGCPIQPLFSTSHHYAQEYSIVVF